MADLAQAEFIDRLQGGWRVAGHIEVDEAEATTWTLAGGGAGDRGARRDTPWNPLNVCLQAPGGLQFTPFSERAR